MFGLKKIKKELRKLKHSNEIKTIWLNDNSQKIKTLEEKVNQLELIQQCVPCKGVTQKEMNDVVKQIFKKVGKGAAIQSFSYNVNEGLLKYNFIEDLKK